MNLEKIDFSEKYNNQIRLFSKRVRHPSFNDEFIDIEIYYDYISISEKNKTIYYKNIINLENIAFRLHDNIICINEYYLFLHKKKINFYIVLFGDYDSLMIVELCYNSKTNSLSLVKYNKFSLHYHVLKKESWYVANGSFQYIWIDTEKGEEKQTAITKGQCITINRGEPHQLIAIEDNSEIGIAIREFQI